MAESTESVRVQPSQRLWSLDVLRGLDVALMILVNDPGAHAYDQLEHAPWNGCTLTDLVFPTFLFMVGVSIVFSYSTRLKHNVPKSEILLHTLKRAALIVAIGIALHMVPYFHLGTLRYYGVLQRIGICYAIAGAIYLFGKVRGCVIAIVIALVGYWFVMLHMRVPGYGMPGVDVPVLDPMANMSGWLDRQTMSMAHLYEHKGFDPEGTLSTIPAVATALLGVLTGVWVRTTRSAAQKAGWLAGAGAVLMAAGWLWSYDMPLNKRLWTSSYVLWVGGIAMIALAALYYLIDRKPRAAGAEPSAWLKPWLAFGSNALTAYVVAEALSIALDAVRIGGKNPHRILFNAMPLWLGPTVVRSLIYAVLFVLICFVPMWVLYKKKIFIRL